jgi:hypothetical protein
MARFATVDSQDHSPAVWILTLLTLIYTTLTTLMRAAIKFRMLGLDDGVAAFAQLFACGNAFSVIYALIHGLAQSPEPDDRDRNNRLHYAGVSETQTPRSTKYTMLTLPDTASKHDTLPSDISGGESLHDLVPEKDIPKIKSFTRYADMQYLRSSVDSLGHRSCHYSFCQLWSSTHVVVSRRYCLQRSRERRPFFPWEISEC